MYYTSIKTRLIRLNSIDSIIRRLPSIQEKEFVEKYEYDDEYDDQRMECFIAISKRTTFEHNSSDSE